MNDPAHEGPEPPKVCPVCGVPGEDFELILEAPKEPIKMEQHAYRCLNCEYVHEGDTPPDICPVCGLGVDGFEVVPLGKKEKPHQ